MLCAVCESFSLKIICKKCLNELPLNLTSRILDSNVKVYSFYGYSDIAFLLHSKYHILGSRIYNLLSLQAAKAFASLINADSSLNVDSSIREASILGLDDYPYHGYSHTGIIVKNFAKALKLKPRYGILKAQNQVKYAGQSLAYRQANPKRFFYDYKDKRVILCDDIITTGTSFNEAIRIIESGGIKVLFCLSLSDARG